MRNRNDNNAFGLFFFPGGYGFVFIAQDTSSVKDYALKVCITYMYIKALFQNTT